MLSSLHRMYICAGLSSITVVPSALKEYFQEELAPLECMTMCREGWMGVLQVAQCWEHFLSIIRTLLCPKSGFQVFNPWLSKDEITTIPLLLILILLQMIFEIISKRAGFASAS